MRKLLGVIAATLILSGCGGAYDGSEAREYIDKCIIAAGPQSEKNNVTDYCFAMWRQSQREKQGK